MKTLAKVEFTTSVRGSVGFFRDRNRCAPSRVGQIRLHGGWRVLWLGISPIDPQIDPDQRNIKEPV